MNKVYLKETPYRPVDPDVLLVIFYNGDCYRLPNTLRTYTVITKKEFMENKDGLEIRTLDQTCDTLNRSAGMELHELYTLITLVRKECDRKEAALNTPDKKCKVLCRERVVYLNKLLSKLEDMKEEAYETE